MKTTLLLLLGSLAVAALPLQAGIDFTLHDKHEGEGMPDSGNRYISDGDSHIYLHIPRGWSANGAGSSLLLLPDQASSEVVIRQLSGPPALPLDPTGLEALRKATQATLPQGASNIKASGETKDLLPFPEWKSFEAAFDYDFYGVPMRRSVLYINMVPGRVIQVSVSAPTTEFDQVHELTRQLMFNWFEPKRELSPESAKDYEEGKYQGG